MNQKRPSNQIWPAIFALMVIIAILWVFSVVCRPAKGEHTSIIASKLVCWGPGIARHYDDPSGSMPQRAQGWTRAGRACQRSVSNVGKRTTVLAIQFSTIAMGKIWDTGIDLSAVGECKPNVSQQGGVMPRYRFALDASTLGTFEQFPSDDDAKSHASCVADEINRNSTITHCILVFDEAGQLIARAEGIETSDEDALKGTLDGKVEGKRASR